MADDVILNKAGIIERCVSRIREEYAESEENLFDNVTRQDSIILNLQRACEASINLAMHLVKIKKIGVPQDSRGAFLLLSESGGLESDQAEQLARMVGFRNIAVHDYRKLNLEIVKSIITNDLDVFLRFSKWAIQSDDPA